MHGCVFLVGLCNMGGRFQKRKETHMKQLRQLNTPASRYTLLPNRVLKGKQRYKMLVLRHLTVRCIPSEATRSWWILFQREGVKGVQGLQVTWATCGTRNFWLIIWHCDYHDFIALTFDSVPCVVILRHATLSSDICDPLLSFTIGTRCTLCHQFGSATPYPMALIAYVFYHAIRIHVKNWPLTAIATLKTDSWLP